MKLEEEIKLLKKQVKILNSRIIKIDESNKQLKKLILGNELSSEKKKPKRRISYIDRLDLEKRMRNIISRD